MEDGEFVVDSKLYNKRFVIERANTWINSFNYILVQFTVKAENWMSLHYMALSIRLLK